jgi:hypothetical protein
MLGSRPWLTVLVAALLAAQASPAAAALIIFDFEDGLQGWELLVQSARVQTQVLGGQWAIFGDGIGFNFDGSRTFGGMAAIRRTFDLTDISSITVDVFFLGSFEGPVPNPIYLSGLDEPRTGVPLDPTANPGTIVFDVSDVEAVARFRLSWGTSHACIPIGPCGPEVPEDSLLAIIDNITFHPIPEPVPTALLGIGLAGLAGLRRWRRER